MIYQHILFHNSDSMIVKHVAEGEHKGIPVSFLDFANQEGHVIHDIPIVSKKGKRAFYDKINELDL